MADFTDSFAADVDNEADAENPAVPLPEIPIEPLPAVTAHAKEEVEVIPPGIDPVLLYIWQEKRRREKERDEEDPKTKFAPPKTTRYRSLSATYAAYVGSVGMMVAIVFGILNGYDRHSIVDQACFSLLIFTIVGYVFGWIADFCVRESVIAILREILERSDQAQNESESPSI